MVSAPSNALGFIKVNDRKYINPHSITQIEHNVPDDSLWSPKNENILISLSSKNLIEINHRDIKEKGMTVDKILAKAQEAATTGKVIDLYS